MDNTGGPSYTIGLKYYPKNIKGLFRLNTPGVGTYNLSKDFVAPCYRMDHEKRTNLNESLGTL